MSATKADIKILRIRFSLCCPCYQQGWQEALSGTEAPSKPIMDIFAYHLCYSNIAAGTKSFVWEYVVRVFFVRLVSPQSQSTILLIGTWVHMIKKTFSSICTTKMKQYTADEHYSLLGLFELRSLHFRFLDTEPMVLTLSSLQAQR